MKHLEILVFLVLINTTNSQQFLKRKNKVMIIIKGTYLTTLVLVPSVVDLIAGP